MLWYFQSNWGISTSDLCTIICNDGFTIAITDKLEQHTEHYSKLQQWVANWLLLVKFLQDIKMVNSTITVIQTVTKSWVQQLKSNPYWR